MGVLSLAFQKARRSPPKLYDGLGLGGVPDEGIFGSLQHLIKIDAGNIGRINYYVGSAHGTSVTKDASLCRVASIPLGFPLEAFP